eukprot:3191736-Prorocentrum_lima.AAC.1
MTSSLVGSEMCIRDSACNGCKTGSLASTNNCCKASVQCPSMGQRGACNCLLYTSDAADDM